MKKILILSLVVLISISCKVEQAIIFNEINLLYNENSIVEINTLKATGNDKISETINSTIENHMADLLNFTDDDTNTIPLKEAISQFDNQFTTFKDDFEESALVWEATFDTEVTYQSSSIISIAVNSYLNTGGAHGNTNITFYNFDITTAKVIEMKNLITDVDAFTKIANEYFLMETNNQDVEYFFGEEFHLPDNLGFNEEGVILFYNVYEIASYATGITEFTIPFDEISSYLNEIITEAI